MTFQLPMPANGLMPHKLPMRLIDNVLSVNDDGSGTAEAIIAPGNIFLDPSGVLMSEALVELMAQAFAAVSGYTALRTDRPRETGYLVGVRGVRFIHQARAGDRLVVKVAPTGEFAGFVLIAGEVLRHGHVLASGDLKIWTAAGNDP